MIKDEYNREIEAGFSSETKQVYRYRIDHYFSSFIAGASLWSLNVGVMVILDEYTYRQNLEVR